ncbi:MAG: thermonuclease family protein [Pseudomonadota bacterium]
MSKHWRPDWSVIDGYARDKSSRSGVVPVVLSAVVIGLAVGGALSWAARQADSGPSSAIEWNAVQAVPTRAPDAQDIAWEKRAQGQSTSPGRTYEGQQIRVIDGDTFDIGGERIRVAGIDAPETHPSRCANEAAFGAAATQKLAELLRGGPLWISGTKTDRYGRSVRTVRVNGEDVADAMISAGLARNYDGKQRQSSC